MEGKIITLNGNVKCVNLTCTPCEYLIIKQALRHFTEINPDDIKLADEVLKDADNKISEVAL